MKVSAKALFQLDNVSNVTGELDIELTDQTYIPKIDDLRSDWVATVAVPAFKRVREQRNQKQPIKSFCSIGTGAALDVLAAIEILGCNQVSLTDMHINVVKAAVRNVEKNSIHPLNIIHGIGDLLTPLSGHVNGIDIIYENLPNIPLEEDKILKTGQKSSTFIAKRTEAIPQNVTSNLLDLHYLTLQQAKPMLAKNGRVLSSIGARIPLSAIFDMAKQAGYDGRLITYSWKEQSEAEEVLRGYKHWQEQGLGPFHFYPTDVLKVTFAESDKDDCYAIEGQLEEYRLDASQALRAHRAGLKIGHTVAVLESSLR